MGSLLLADIHAPLGSFFPCLLFLGYPIFFIYLMNRSVMGDIGCVTALLMAFTVTYLLFVIWKIEDTRVHYLASAESSHFSLPSRFSKKPSTRSTPRRWKESKSPSATSRSA
jgi:hypothetical protein